MSGISRRRFMLAGGGLAITPTLARATGTSISDVSAADSFARGGLKGFVIGTVRNNRDAAFFDALAKTGANVARIFFPFTKCQRCDKYDRAYDDVENLKRILDLLRARGIRGVVVGGYQGVERPEFWTNTALRESFVDNWQWFARTFGNDPVVAGLDLMNEPNPPWPSGKLAEAHSHWRPLAEQAIAAIRGEQVRLPIVYEGVAGGSSQGLRDLLPVSDVAIVYSVHFYTPHDITHQTVSPSWTRRIPYPAGLEWGLGKWDPEIGVTAWNSQRLELALRDAINFQHLHNVPIYVGEFSCVRWAPDNSRQRYIADCLALFEKHGWSWTYHEFRGWPGWDAEIASENPADTQRSVGAPTMTILHNAMLRNVR